MDASSLIANPGGSRWRLLSVAIVTHSWRCVFNDHLFRNRNQRFLYRRMSSFDNLRGRPAAHFYAFLSLFLLGDLLFVYCLRASVLLAFGSHWCLREDDASGCHGNGQHSFCLRETSGFRVRGIHAEPLQPLVGCLW